MIDDGLDLEETPRLLDLLERYDTKATFFLTDQRDTRYPDLAAEINRRGHEIEHHSHSHPSLSFWHMGSSRLAAELDQSLTAFAPFRPT